MTAYVTVRSLNHETKYEVEISWPAFMDICKSAATVFNGQYPAWPSHCRPILANEARASTSLNRTSHADEDRIKLSLAGPSGLFEILAPWQSRSNNPFNISFAFVEAQHTVVIYHFRLATGADSTRANKIRWFRTSAHPLSLSATVGCI